MKSAPATTKASAKPRSDEQIKDDVLCELAYEPSVKVTDIGVMVAEGVVTLVGSTSDHGKKWQAVRAAKRVAGVKAIADEIKVELAGPHLRTDADIAAAAVHQLEWSTTIPKGTTTVTVRDGWITLEGEVEWWYQKNAAEDVMQYMIGVRGIRNQITIKPLISATDVETAIKAAFDRNAMLDAAKIQVVTYGSKVELTGKVANHSEREEAERVAWAAPGVLSVDNQIALEWNWRMFQ